MIRKSVSIFILFVVACYGLNITLSTQGNNIRNITNGSLVSSANLTVSIYNSTVLAPFWTQNFSNAIINGSWNQQLFDVPMILNKLYFIDYSINSDDLDFDGIEMLNFTGPGGAVNWSDVIDAPAFITTESDPYWSANYSLFNTTWSSTYNSSYDAKVTDNQTWNETKAMSLFATQNLTVARNGTGTCGSGTVVQNITSNSSGITVQCVTDATGGGGGSGSGWVNTSTNTTTGVVIHYGENGNKWSLNTKNKSVLHDDFMYVVATYQRITTAPTIDTTETNVVDGIMNFPSAASAAGDGGLVIGGGTATNLAILNATKMSYYGIRAKLVATTTRRDMMGIFKTATTVNMNTSQTGIFFWHNVTAGGFWFARVCNAGTCTSTNTTVATDTSWHTFEIVGNNPDSGEASLWTFYIDGTNRTTITSANRPTTFVSTIGTWVESVDATADTLRVDWIHYEANR